MSGIQNQDFVYVGALPNHAVKVAPRDELRICAVDEGS